MELRRIYNSDDGLIIRNLNFITLWAVYFGDFDFAMDAIEKGNETDSGFFRVLWCPAMQKTRQTTRFKEFAREVGLVDYWKEYGWPDLCRPVGDDDFVCD